MENFLVGMSKKLFVHLDKLNAKINKKKSERKLAKQLPLGIEIEESNKIKSVNVRNVKETQNQRNRHKDEEEKVETELLNEETESAEEKDEEIEGTEAESNDSDIVDEGTDSSEDEEDGNDYDEDVVEAANIEENPRKRKQEVLSESKNEESTNKAAAPKLSGVASFFTPEPKDDSETSSDDEETVSTLQGCHCLSPRLCF